MTEGIGKARPEETQPLGPDDEGIGSVRHTLTERTDRSLTGDASKLESSARFSDREGAMTI